MANRQYEDRPNTFTLFPVQRRVERGPAFTGTLLLPDGTRMRIAAWERVSRNGNIFFSGNIEPERERQQGGYQQPQQGGYQQQYPPHQHPQQHAPGGGFYGSPQPQGPQYHPAPPPPPPGQPMQAPFMPPQYPPQYNQQGGTGQPPAQHPEIQTGGPQRGGYPQQPPPQYPQQPPAPPQFQPPGQQGGMPDDDIPF